MLDSLNIIKIEKLVLKNRLAAGAPYTISSIIYNRENFVRTEYN